MCECVGFLVCGEVDCVVVFDFGVDYDVVVILCGEFSGDEMYVVVVEVFGVFMLVCIGDVVVDENDGCYVVSLGIVRRWVYE